MSVNESNNSDPSLNRHQANGQIQCIMANGHIRQNNQQYQNYNQTNAPQHNYTKNEDGSILSHRDERQEKYLACTNITESQLVHKIRMFFMNYQTKDMASVDNIESHYYEKIRQLKETDQVMLHVNAAHIYDFDARFYWELIVFPADIISFFDRVATAIYIEEFLSDFERNRFDKSIIVQIIGLLENNRMRDLQPRDINKLISIKGIVIRNSDIYPEMKDALFKCTKCGFQVSVKVDKGRIDEPTFCSQCELRNTYEIIHNLCLFTDKQYVKLQETPDQVPHGETPIHINMVMYDSMVDTCRPGDAVEITGIFRAQALRISRVKRVLNSLFKTYVDVISISFIHQNRIAVNKEHEEKSDKIIYTERETREFRRFAERPSVQTDLINIFAGSLWELNDVKKGLLCQLFGGTPKEFDPSFRGRYRSDLNVLLVGDPSTAKSQLLKCVNKVSPRGLYTSGKGSSAVGLTAYITKDPETHEIILESGALVLSDRGICCIDEFDKMDESTKTILHEVMEQQTISIAKSGIVCSLNARTAILAAANPIESRYNPKKSIVYNIMLPPALMSRFDLIYLMLDQTTEAQDEMLAKHICFLFSNVDAETNNQDKIYNQKFLARYINYARMHCRPIITTKAETCLVQAYRELRSMGVSRNVITATPRQLESMIRISEALAKMRLSEIVEESDVYEAKQLLMAATRQSAMDPVTGQIDMNMIATGYSSAHKERIEKLEAVLTNLLV